MTSRRDLSYSRTFPVAVDEAFDRTRVMPLPEMFRRRFGVITPIAAVHDQQGEWGTVGQTRVIELQGPGGGTMRETLTSLDRPRSFGYHLDTITGPMKPLVADVDGMWSFAPAGTGVRITWSWSLLPTSDVAARAMPVFARFWSGYARLGFEDLEADLVS